MPTRSNLSTAAKLVAGGLSCIAIAGIVSLGTKVVVLSAATAMAGMLVVGGNRRVLLGAAFASVLVGSSKVLLLKEAAFYGRFGLFASVVVAQMLWNRSARSNVPLPLLLLLALGVGSFAWSVDQPLTLQRSVGFALLVGVFLTRASAWSERDELRRDIACLAGVVGATFVLGLVLFAADHDWVYQCKLGSLPACVRDRFTGMYENPNTVGLTAGMSLPFLVALAWSARVPAGWAFLAACAGLSLVLSQSRGGLLAGGIGVVVFLLLRERRRRVVYVGVGLAGMLAVASLWTIAPSLAPAPIQAAVERFTAASESGGSGRLQAWSLAVDLAGDRPVRGYGFGTTEQVFGPASLAIEQVFKGETPHNGYLLVLLELGAIGVGLLGWLLIRVGRATWRIPKDDLAAGLIATFAAGLVITLVEAGITSGGSVFAFLFWFSAVALMAEASRPEVDAV